MKQDVHSEMCQERIGRLLWHYSLPAIIATVATSIYNIIDRIFIGQVVGPLAISGMAITLPLMNILTAFGMLISTGAAALVSIRLGKYEQEHAEKTLGNALLTTLIMSIAISFVVFIFLDDILYLFGASSLTILYARSYMRILLIANPITQVFFCLNAVLRSSGYPTKAMTSLLVTMIVNIVMVYFFVYRWQMGIEGAALATVWGQVIGLIWNLWHFCQNSSQVHFKRHIFSFDCSIVKHICTTGLPSCIIHICTCFVVALFNCLLEAYAGDYAIGAYGIVSLVVNFITVIVLGLSHGMQPIVGYNYGAARYDRVGKILWRTVFVGSIITIVGTILMQFFSLQIANCFTKDIVMAEMISSGMQMYTVMFPLVGFQLVVSYFFQSIGKPRVSICLSLSRQVVFLIPTLLIVPQFLGLNGIWYSMPIAESLATILTALVLFYFYRKSEHTKIFRK